MYASPHLKSAINNATACCHQGEVESCTATRQKKTKTRCHCHGCLFGCGAAAPLGIPTNGCWGMCWDVPSVSRSPTATADRIPAVRFGHLRLTGPKGHEKNIQENRIDDGSTSSWRPRQSSMFYVNAHASSHPRCTWKPKRHQK